MKSILLSIRPEWVAKILNGEKTIEVRKQFPKDYIGWVYIYCTKDSKTKLSSNSFRYYVVDNKDYKNYLGNWNGKVLARFWCDKVEEIRIENGCFYNTDTNLEYAILEKSCLSLEEIGDYLGVYEYQEEIIKVGYAIHISKLEIFDKPKELSEFYKANDQMEYIKSLWDNGGLPDKDDYDDVILTKAPRNCCYIEGEE